MFTRVLALTAIAVAPLCLVACSKESESKSVDTAPDTSTTAGDTNLQVTDDTEDSTMPDLTDAESQAAAFAQLITQALIDADTDTIIAHIKAVNLPTGWQQMVVPMFNDMKGYDLQGVIRPRSEFTNEELNWPAETPEPFKAVEQILYVSYETKSEDESESGNNTFPLIYEDGQWMILLAQ